jgi:uncharacterized protein (DUF1501 family)
MHRRPFKGCDDFRQTSGAARRSWVEDPLHTRRRFLAGGLGAALTVYGLDRTLTVYGLDRMPFARMLEAAEAQAAAAPDAPVLVTVFLPGGCDLLDTLVPVSQLGRYADLRKTTKVTTATPLGSTGLGANPALTQGTAGGIKGLFERGKVGFLPGIDYGNPDLSHFHSRHFWETGLITERDGPGWLGRWLDRNGSADNPLQGISADYSLSPVLRSARAPVAAVSSPGEAQLYMDGVWGEMEAYALGAYDRLAAPRPPRAGPAASYGAARLAKAVGDRLAPFAEKDGHDPLAPPVAYPKGNEFADRLSRLAALIAQPLGVRVATIEANAEFDTHDNQPAELAKSLGTVSEALAAFQADLEARGQADRVLTFVWSEFGRRPESNESAGTDHGAGGLAWVMGNHAAPGILTDYPSLTAFDKEDNLQVTVDFRKVYASLIEGWLRTDASAVIPSAGAFGRLALVR